MVWSGDDDDDDDAHVLISRLTNFLSPSDHNSSSSHFRFPSFLRLLRTVWRPLQKFLFRDSLLSLQYLLSWLLTLLVPRYLQYRYPVTSLSNHKFLLSFIYCSHRRIQRILYTELFEPSVSELREQSYTALSLLNKSLYDLRVRHVADQRVVLADSFCDCAFPFIEL
jgi:hypothetical protein